MKKSIECQVIYDHNIQKVWKALTDPEAISIWLMPTTFKPILGYQFEFHTKSAPGFDGIVECEY